MNERIEKLFVQALEEFKAENKYATIIVPNPLKEKFAELIVEECINREELLGAIARGWCSEKNSHKTMDPDLALAIFDEVERQIKQRFGVK